MTDKLTPPHSPPLFHNFSLVSPDSPVDEKKNNVMASHPGLEVKASPQGHSPGRTSQGHDVDKAARLKELGFPVRLLFEEFIER